MLICNCTGVSYMASAFETPGMVISMDRKLERWAPLNDCIHKVIDCTVNPEFDLVFKELAELMEVTNSKTHY